MTTPDHAVHPDDDLVLLATGHPVPAEVSVHLDSCPRCAHELAALRAVSELLRDPVHLVDAPVGLWDKVSAEIDRDEDGRPLLTVVDGEVPDDAPASAAAVDRSPAPTGPTRRRRFGGAWLVAAAAAGIVVGGVGVRALESPAPQPTPSTVVLGQTKLDTLDTQQVLGAASAVRVDGHLDLDVDTPALDPGPGYLEVWLINKDLRRMVSVGVLRPGDGNQRFAIDQSLIDQGYVIVDISREGYDDKPEHSGDSIARGTLAL
ncbi:anti-sigma factor [Arthrobacter sp. NEB 688]|uniref:anti-sigma factor domain-containing protein n=1 Tax=Arthrobacter sp. NEB 688 TaxID=904039 RepID=UPI001566F83B|nr:anti-sigma factor [Arthrobacter sp. NEB 688]QKE84167.1 hypothetical protein HL663_09620 [Arthrobacter sp. NEB 688]